MTLVAASQLDCIETRYRLVTYQKVTRARVRAISSVAAVLSLAPDATNQTVGLTIRRPNLRRLSEVGRKDTRATE